MLEMETSRSAIFTSLTLEAGGLEGAALQLEFPKVAATDVEEVSSIWTSRAAGEGCCCTSPLPVEAGGLLEDGVTADIKEVSAVPKTEKGAGG